MPGEQAGELPERRIVGRVGRLRGEDDRVSLRRQLVDPPPGQSEAPDRDTRGGDESLGEWGGAARVEAALDERVEVDAGDPAPRFGTADHARFEEVVGGPDARACGQLRGP